MSEEQFVKMAKDAVVRSYNSINNCEPTIDMDAVYIVWLCKTLQNNKALLSTTVSDGKYYEFTYDGDKKCGYLDTYVKVKNQVILEGKDDGYRD